jgi:hypothetical protein
MTSVMAMLLYTKTGDWMGFQISSRIIIPVKVYVYDWMVWSNSESQSHHITALFKDIRFNGFNCRK